MSDHTPGPWRVDEDSVGIDVVGEGMRVAAMYLTGDREAHENARLIAAAPDMLEALRELVDACAYVSPIVGAVATEASVKDIRNAGKFMKAVERASAAIAKATGAA